jgi:P2-related tail formation protein
MNLFEERIRKQIEKSKQEAAEKTAKEYEKSLTAQYQPIHNVTVGMSAVTETQGVFVTESKINKGGNIVTENRECLSS